MCCYLFVGPDVVDCGKLSRILSQAEVSKSLYLCPFRNFSWLQSFRPNNIQTTTPMYQGDESFACRLLVFADIRGE